MIKIPENLRTERYYVTINNVWAFSSWKTLEEAKISAKKLLEHYPKDGEKVFGIIKVNAQGKQEVKL